MTHAQPRATYFSCSWGPSSGIVCINVDSVLDAFNWTMTSVFFLSPFLSCYVYNQESVQGFIRVQAPQFSKVSMAVQLTKELQAADVLTRFLSQDR